MIMFSITALAVSQTESEIEAKFTDYSLKTDTLQIKARLFIPDSYDSAYPYPVVLTLHGLGECGTDNKIHVLRNRLAITWGTDAFQAENPCFIFSPQCPLNTYWNDPSVHQAVMVLLDSLINTYSIDTSRIYITGLSLGGMATWSYLRNNPEKYAAAIPVCGSIGWDQIENHIREIKHIPVWNFHGNIDDIVDVDESRAIIKEYKEQAEYPLLTHNYYRMEYNLSDDQIDGYITNHVDLIYSEVPNIAHNVWDVTYRIPEPKKWLFKQKKRTTSNLTLEKQEDIVDVSGDYKFDLYCPEKVEQVSVWLGHVRSCDWIQIDSFDPSSGQYIFNSRMTDDHPFALLKFLAHDSLGYVIAKEYSDILSINNEENGLPYVEILNDPTIKQDIFSTPQLPLELQLGDPEDSLLQVSISISSDNGFSFRPYSSFETTPELRTELFQLENLIRADQMVIRVEVSDGEHLVSAETMNFTNSIGYLNVSIPDTAFLYALIDEGVDTNGDSLISYEEAEDVKSLIIDTRGGWGCNPGNENSIVSLVGIEAFINLDTLWYSCGKLEALNISENKNLKYLNCGANYITSLDISNNIYLTELNCTENQLTNLDVSRNTGLEVLNCGMNQLTGLDLSNNVELQYLNCWANDLSAIDISKNVNLTFLDLQANQIAKLDVSKNVALTELRCESNNLSTLVIANNILLDALYCGNNEIATLDISNNTLLTYMWLVDMPSLGEICVWESFNIDSMGFEDYGSPNICFQTDCNGDCSIVGFVDYIHESGIFINPNPTNSLLTIEAEYSDHYVIEITSLNGKLILSEEMEGTTHQLDLSSFQKGVYFITIRSDEILTTKKIIKL